MKDEAAIDETFARLVKMGYTEGQTAGSNVELPMYAELAKKHEILLVPSESFGCPGYVRISYCVSTQQIRRSLPAFEKLAKAYGLC